MKPNWLYEDESNEPRLLCDWNMCKHNWDGGCYCCSQISMTTCDDDTGLMCSQYEKGENTEQNPIVIAARNLSNMGESILKTMISRGYWICRKEGRVGPVVNTIEALERNKLIVESHPTRYIITDMGKEVLEWLTHVGTKTDV